MTHEELRASGLLELYVADACSDDERMLVENAMASDPSIQAEVNAIARAIELDALEHAVPPPTYMLDRINDQIDASTAPRTHTSPRTQFGVRYLIAASIGILIGLLTSLWLYVAYDRSTRAMEQASRELSELRDRQRQMAAATRVSDDLVRALATGTVQRVDLLRAPTGPANAHATVYWNTSTHAVVVDRRTLPELPSDVDYQLWAIVDGTPVSLGVLPRADSGTGFASMQPTPSAGAFAITIEPRGGKPTPTLDRMVVSGAAS
jgi:anti-sigma-K factor RskA